jgi:glutathione peroxidase-family protein
MRKHCQDACYKWKQEIEQVRVEYVDEDQASFFDLSAKNSTGHVINFQRFEGVVTLVTILMKSCENGGNTESTYRSLEALHDVWPYGLEIVIFPFEHPSLDYSKNDCQNFNSVHTTPRTKVHSMEMSKINGPETHEVLKYLKTVFHIDEFDGNFAPFFFINPDGNKIEFHRKCSELVSFYERLSKLTIF